MEIRRQQQKDNENSQAQAEPEIRQRQAHGSNLATNVHRDPPWRVPRASDGRIHFGRGTTQVFSTYIRRQGYHSQPIQPIVLTHFRSIYHVRHIAYQGSRSAIGHGGDVLNILN